MTKLDTKTITSIGLFTAITCILAPMSLPIPISPVPITLTNLVIYMSTVIIGAKYATISYLVYLLIGFIGLPVFSNFQGGIGILVSPTGGYLVGFIFIPIIGGVFLKLFKDKKYMHVLGFIIGTIITYILGTAWLSFQMDISFISGLSIGVIPYIPFDLIKIVLGVSIGHLIKNRLKANNININ